MAAFAELTAIGWKTHGKFFLAGVVVSRGMGGVKENEKEGGATGGETVVEFHSSEGTGRGEFVEEVRWREIGVRVGIAATGQPSCGLSGEGRRSW
jgi:hypothetical protein